MTKNKAFQSKRLYRVGALFLMSIYIGALFGFLLGFLPPIHMSIDIIIPQPGGTTHFGAAGVGFTLLFVMGIAFLNMKLYNRAWEIWERLVYIDLLRIRQEER